MLRQWEKFPIMWRKVSKTVTKKFYTFCVTIFPHADSNKYIFTHWTPALGKDKKKSKAQKAIAEAMAKGPSPEDAIKEAEKSSSNPGRR